MYIFNTGCLPSQLIERAGRRFLMLTSIVGDGLVCLAMGFVYYYNAVNGNVYVYLLGSRVRSFA